MVSESPEAANLVKLSGNFLIATVIESLGEAMALAGKAGIDKHTYLEILTSTLFDAPVYKTYGGLIADREVQSRRVSLRRWGSRTFDSCWQPAKHWPAPLPIAGLLRDRFLTLLANGGADLDWSAIATLSDRDAGVSSDDSA